MIFRPPRHRKPPITDQGWHPNAVNGGRPAPITDVYQPPQHGPRPNPYQPGGHGGHGGSQPPGQPPRPPGNVQIPGFTPNYQDLIQNDPYFAQIRDMLSAQSQSEAAQNQSQLGQAFINFGETPQGYDPTVAGAASNNPYSTLAQMKQAHEQNLRSERNQLAARGILQSGEHGYQMGQENNDYLQNQYQARTELLDFINGVQAAFAQNENNRQGQLVQAGQQAYQNQMGLPQNQPTSGFNANLASQWGHGSYYKGKDGNLYGQNGQAINTQAEVKKIRDLLHQWQNQGKSQNWIRGTRAWDSLQFLLGSK